MKRFAALVFLRDWTRISRTSVARQSLLAAMSIRIGQAVFWVHFLWSRSSAMALQWRQIWVIFHRDALNCEGTIVNMTVSGYETTLPASSRFVLTKPGKIVV